jgi:long-chain acyl-CoA synthetase
MFCYTSGTTGDAKGAKETHEAMVADMYFYENGGIKYTEDDIAISYLPYAHVYEQCSFIQAISKGFKVGYYSGDPLKLLEDV